MNAEGVFTPVLNKTYVPCNFSKRFIQYLKNCLWI